MLAAAAQGENAVELTIKVNTLTDDPVEILLDGVFIDSSYSIVMAANFVDGYRHALAGVPEDEARDDYGYERGHRQGRLKLIDLAYDDDVPADVKLSAKMTLMRQAIIAGSETQQLLDKVNSLNHWLKGIITK